MQTISQGTLAGDGKEILEDAHGKLYLEARRAERISGNESQNTEHTKGNNRRCQRLRGD